METSLADLDDFDEYAENTDPAHLATVATGISIEPAEPKKRKKSKTSPTQRSLKYLRKQGCELVAVVEHWNPWANIRQDLFGIIDVIAIKGDQTIAVQSCSGTDVSKRVAKMVEATWKNPETKTEHLVVDSLLRAGFKVFVHGWKRNAAEKWVLREVELS